MSDSLLDEIVEDVLESVTFTRFGVRLDFGHAWFTAHCWPKVAIGSASWASGDRGYRDALCAFIAQDVAAAHAAPGVGVVLTFAHGTIGTNPQATEFEGPEIAQLAVYDSMYQRSHLEIWRPGEGAFSNLDQT